MDKNMNAAVVLKNVEACIAELEAAKDTYEYDHERMVRTGWWPDKKAFKIDAIYKELSIFDWWPETLSMSRLKEMKSFLETAIRLGYTGYVCFKVGEAGCAHGMWAAKAESEDGYSPKGETLFHSFRPGDWYWDVCDENGKWQGKYDRDHNGMTLKEVKAWIKEKEVA